MAPSKTDRNTEKIKTYEAAIAEDHLLLHLNSCHQEVEVPAHLKNNPALTLKISERFQGHIEHDNNRVLAHLRFNDEYFCCIIPWNSVWSITDSSGKNTMWAEDVPKELLIKNIGIKLKNLGARFFPGKKSKHLEEVPQENSERSRINQQTSAELDKKRRSLLKRVK